MGNGQERFETIMTQEQVVVSVPKASKHMRLEGPYKENNIPRHWKYGQSMQPANGKGRPVIVNRHFYGLNLEDLDNTIVAQVTLKEKTVKDGRKFILVDCHKTSGKIGIYEMKFSDVETEDGVPIIGTRTKIVFRPRLVPFSCANHF